MMKKAAFRSRLVQFCLCALTSVATIGGSGSAHATGATPDPLYRLVFPGNGDHLYTTSLDEAFSAVTQFGYRYEGVAAKCFTSPQDGTVPLFRLSSSSNGDHFLVASEQEAEIAVASYHYQREGITCYVYPSQSSGTCPFYRDQVAGHHFYTLSWSEALAALRKAGTAFEGVAAYLFPSGDGCPN